MNGWKFELNQIPFKPLSKLSNWCFVGWGVKNLISIYRWLIRQISQHNQQNVIQQKHAKGLDEVLVELCEAGADGNHVAVSDERCSHIHVCNWREEKTFSLTIELWEAFQCSVFSVHQMGNANSWEKRVEDIIHLLFAVMGEFFSFFSRFFALFPGWLRVEVKRTRTVEDYMNLTLSKRISLFLS